MTDSNTTKPYLLHTNWRSTCSGRLRIALNLKKLPFNSVYVNLDEGEQRTEAYLSLNPSGTVPCLQNHDRSILITQSLAAIEYLDELYPDRLPRLLPDDVLSRAQVRSLTSMIACDLQPLTTTRMSKQITALGGSARNWSVQIYTNGLGLFEKRLAETAGVYCYGDSITMADICLVPAVWKALMLELDVESLFPRIWEVYSALSREEGVNAAHGNRQPDHP